MLWLLSLLRVWGGELRQWMQHTATMYADLTMSGFLCLWFCLAPHTSVPELRALRLRLTTPSSPWDQDQGVVTKRFVVEAVFPVFRLGCRVLPLKSSSPNTVRSLGWHTAGGSRT